jgi:regulator of replication initiation timing
MEIDKTEFKDWSESASRALEREREEMMERVQTIDGMARVMRAVGDILAENERLKAENESLNAENESLNAENDTLQTQLLTERELRTKAEMQLGEMSKLSVGVAKKASQEELLPALRVFVNKSKRKKLEKRIAVKEMVLEMANANGLTLPEEFAAVIDSLDDEEVASPTYVSNTVTVQPGGINVQQANTVSK